MEVNHGETFQVTSLGRNVNKPNVSMLLFPPLGAPGGGGAINIISNKISKSMHGCAKLLLKHVLPINAKHLIYISLVFSHLNYCVLIWGYKGERLTKHQKRIIRIINHSKYNSHTEPIFKSLKLLKL